MPKKTAITVDKATIESFVAEYNELSKKSKLIDDRKKYLSEAIKNYAQSNGTKDDKGSFYCTSNLFTYGAQCKKSVSLDEDKAKEFVKSKGFDDCLKTVITLDELAIEKRVSCGDITPAELEKITKTKTSYAVTVKPIETAEEMPEVQQTEVAASRKKPTILRKKK